jgi:hypothetical protein
LLQIAPQKDSLVRHVFVDFEFKFLDILIEFFQTEDLVEALPARQAGAPVQTEGLPKVSRPLILLEFDLCLKFFFVLFLRIGALSGLSRWDRRAKKLSSFWCAHVSVFKACVSLKKKQTHSICNM